MHSADEVIGLELHGFVVTHALRSGGMGDVYEAKHPMIGHRVAVKVLRREFSADADVCARFLREARVMSAVRHRNVVEIHNFGQLPSGGAYLMMELIEGETLSEVIAREAPMDPVRALKLCEEILAGLTAAHAVGVVHRDLKPGNIVLMRESSGDLVLKVLDFGLAQQAEASSDLPSLEAVDRFRHSRSSLIAGTPEYISPEQAAGKSVDGKGDLYALGVILFEMLTGHLPFESDSGWELLDLHRQAIPPLVSSLVSTVHPQLDAFVDRLLGKDPAKRAESAKSARTMVQTIAEVIRTTPPVVTPLLGPVVRQMVPPARRRTPTLRTAGRAAGIVLLGLGASVLALSFTASARSAAPVVEQAAAPQAAAPIVEDEEVIAVIEPQAPPSGPVVAVQPPVTSRRRAPPKSQRTRGRPPAQARPVAGAPCEVNETWRLRVQQQVELLEQQSNAAMPDTANPMLVAGVRNHARLLSVAVSTTDSAGCAQIEAQVGAWKAGIR